MLSSLPILDNPQCALIYWRMIMNCILPTVTDAFKHLPCHQSHHSLMDRVETPPDSQREETMP